MAHNRSSSRSPVTIYTDKSPTLFEALRKMTTQSPRQMYLAHLRFLFFDEAAAKKGIKPAIDFLLRDYQVRPDFHLAVIRGSSTRQVLELLTPAEALPVMELYKSLKVSEKAWAPTSTVTVQDLLQKFTKSGVEPVLTGLTLRGDIAEGKQTSNVMQSSVSARYQYTGIGVFRDDRLLGWLNDADSKAYNYITNHITSSVAATPCPGSDGYFVAEVDRSEVKVIPRLVKGDPQIRIDATVEANVAEVGCANVDLTQEQSLLDLQQAARRQLKQVLATGVRNAQTL
ncbi:Ger(x)C family spore germination protein [Paenibacillus ginsengarvi]|uniref:Ger(X)C family spore germination protein n=1 Tax=Paenibacillus ginsengarvi TaxID=400777 RepID=A0A3B0BD59_9BACL|nr:Ger(x)C family spore germination C-terminal domain-containing protein [Paenibacillus ginsengarvi]RKN70046.1 Ger(x)C family spore germination protein [Paenibacillus ginsengarvi]